MKKLLQQIILHSALLLMWLIPFDTSTAKENQLMKDEVLQKEVNNWMSQTVLGFEEVYLR